MAASTSQTSEPSADAHCLQLEFVEFGADVMTLPGAHNQARANRSRELARRVSVTQQFVGAGNTAAPPDVVVDSSHVSSIGSLAPVHPSSSTIGAELTSPPEMTEKSG